MVHHPADSGRSHGLPKPYSAMGAASLALAVVALVLIGREFVGAFQPTYRPDLGRHALEMQPPNHAGTLICLGFAGVLGLVSFLIPNRDQKPAELGFCLTLLVLVLVGGLFILERLTPALKAPSPGGRGSSMPR